ncbi:MAG: DNA-directed RNA polymerase subunit alpha [Planctomycetota bacterium]|nr:DNA-directed RNA polymerase subunit alpha [Planctomycetota bacterium]MDG2084771.1 DNA-directed RNA polymerase subunit alpha [Planctomycetota bacterium]HCW45166.1 DNA-directed RNA polymerase subunit alpha [Planctomycetota bacterium]
MSMRVRWREFELPNRVECDLDTKNSQYGNFVIEPFEKGYGHTIGNSLRRVLLSSIEGAALVEARIDGVDHEFSTKEGVLEDIAHVILNLKQVLVELRGVQEAEMTIRKSGKGPITAGDIEHGDDVVIHNPDLVIATLTADVDFQAVLKARIGRGYVTATENAEGHSEIGHIWLDSTFSPVTRVRYHVEATRVGQLTNYDKLILEVWTNGTIDPESVLVEAGKILRKHLTPVVKYFELGSEVLQPRLPEISLPDDEDEEMRAILDMPISQLELSVRASNCLESMSISTLRELLRMREDDLLRIRNFGQTSLDELKLKLVDMNLELGQVHG